MNKAEQEILKTLKTGLGLTSAEQEILTNYIDKLQEENEELKELNNAGIEKIRKLEKENYEYFKQLDLDYVDNNYVSKDKIWERIEELEGQEDWYIKNKNLDELYGIIDILKELLEEN